MKNLIRIIEAITIVGLSFGASPAARAQAPDTVKKEAPVTKKASGTFEVKLTQQPLADSTAAQAKLGRMFIEKQFSGGLQGTGRGEMLTAQTDVSGSAGYVAIERVSGSLDGKKGSFVFQHLGTMTRGAPNLVITVVPDSGTDELKGLSGKMSINVVNGKHSYVFEYTLPQ